MGRRHSPANGHAAHAKPVTDTLTISVTAADNERTEACIYGPGFSAFAGEESRGMRPVKEYQDALDVCITAAWMITFQVPEHQKTVDTLRDLRAEVGRLLEESDNGESDRPGE